MARKKSTALGRGEEFKQLLAVCARLKFEPHDIAEIAYPTGFSDQSYFDKRFKRAFGESPLSFRNSTVGGDALAARANLCGRVDDSTETN